MKIHSFSCSNFYSLSSQATVNFTVNDKAPDNNGYFRDVSGSRLSKTELVIGANASGKTNLLKAVPFLKWLIVDSFNSDPSSPILIKPFVFGGQKDKPVEFLIEFEITGKIYIYKFILNKDRIILEELKIKTKNTKKITTKKLFSRKWIEQSNQYVVSAKNFGLPKGFEKMVRPNTSIVGVASRLNHKESQKIIEAWQLINTNVSEGGWVMDAFPLGLNQIMELAKTIEFYGDNKNETFKKTANKILSKFDLGIKDFSVIKKNEGTFDVNFIHSFNNKNGELSLAYESSGTKQLFILLRTILLSLDTGGVAIIDELDYSLHPEIVLAILDLFLQPETNPKNAQLLFSTHCHLILNKLDKQQIILIEKNDKGESNSWRLDEMSDVRADDNYYSKYLSGTYGAVPKII